MTTDDSGAPQPNDNLLETAEQLIWALLDGQLPTEQAAQLESMLKENDQVRQRYVECVQIHGDLHQHFGGASDLKIPPTTKSPVLGSLGDLRPDSGTLPPVSE